MKVAIVILNEVKDPSPTRHGFFACGLSMTCARTVKAPTLAGRDEGLSHVSSQPCVILSGAKDPCPGAAGANPRPLPTHRRQQVAARGYGSFAVAQDDIEPVPANHFDSDNLAQAQGHSRYLAAAPPKKLRMAKRQWSLPCYLTH